MSTTGPPQSCPKQGLTVGLGDPAGVLQEQLAGRAGAVREVRADVPDELDRHLGGGTDLLQVPVHVRDEFTGPAGSGGEVTADVTGEDLVEETPLGGADVAAAAVPFLGERGEQAGRPDAYAVQGGGEDLDVVVGLQIQVGTDTEVSTGLVDGFGEAGRGVAEVPWRVREAGPLGRGGAGGLQSGLGAALGVEFRCDSGVLGQADEAQVPEPVRRSVSTGSINSQRASERSPG
ncbi:hypothetical protein GCM10010317_096680 [Streptomyces mirabilis]|uniref:hypothetical protein n=1 Tax=Streptomyces mirabilis TaxID=68239 RepID=UPI00167D2165|nr:hypothetical protein GCM10010317_096680 [Streptomyces mirabilis]